MILREIKPGFREQAMPFGIQPIHLLVVAVVALLIFGSARLPAIGRGIGRMITEFRRGAKGMGGAFMEEVKQPLETPTPTQTNTSQSLTPPSTGPAPSGEALPSANFCIHCGKTNPAGAVFCNHCGSKIIE